MSTSTARQRSRDPTQSDTFPLPNTGRHSSAPKSQSSTGIIRIEQTVTVEEIPSQGNNSTSAVLFGDASQFYQATISAASQFARNLFSATTLQDSNPDTPETPARNKRWIAVALLLALVNFTCIVVDTMMAVILPEIMYDLDIEGFQWTLAGPSVGAAATVLVAGQLYGLYPFKQVYVIFAFLVLLGTVSPGFAPDMTFLFYARILLGIGMAGQQLGAMVFLDHDGTFTDKTRRDFFVSVSTALGLILGPMFGAAFAHRGRFWKWAFYASFSIISIITSILVYILPNHLSLQASTVAWPLQEIPTWRSRFERVDLLGCGLSFLGILALLISFNLAGTWAPWSNNYLYIPIALGGLAILLLILQQLFNIETTLPNRLFPMEYLRHFKTTVLFCLTFLVSGIMNTTLPYVALYQLLTRDNPSAIMTAIYLLFSLTGPHIIPTLLVPVYVGSGLVTSYPLLPSYSIWSLATSTFLITGTVLLFINTPYFFPDQDGIPLIARQFSLACIGWWSAMTLPLAHQIIDVLQPSIATSHISPGQPQSHHPYRNRSFILFASSLGTAISLTTTGSIFMHLGPRSTFSLLTSQLRDPFIHNAVLNPTREDALICLLGYTFVRSGTSAELFEATIGAIRDTFGWSFVVVLGFATLAFILSVAMLVHKIWKGDLDWRNRVVGNVPREWRVDNVPARDSRFEDHRGRRRGRGTDMELVERDVNANGVDTLVGSEERGRTRDRHHSQIRGSFDT